MGRKNRRTKTDSVKDLGFLVNGAALVAVKSGNKYHYRHISAQRAIKTYICPGCNLNIAPAVAHIVAWEAHSLFGQEAAIRDRRHWHTHCWRIF